MGRLPSIIQLGPNRDHKCSYKRETEGDWTRRKGESGVKTEQRFGDAGPGHWHDMATSQGTLAAPGGAPRGNDSPLEPLEGTQSC